MENIADTIISVSHKIEQAARKGHPNYIRCSSCLLNNQKVASLMLEAIQETYGTMEVTTDTGLIQIKYGGLHNMAGYSLYTYTDENGDTYLFDEHEIITRLNKLNGAADD